MFPQNDGEFLLAVDADKEHLLSVWTWENEQVFGRVAVSSRNSLSLLFNTMNTNGSFSSLIASF